MKSRTRCKLSDRLNAYVDNELKPDEKAMISNHLQGCLLCRQELQNIISLNELISSQSEVTTPGYLNQKIMARVTSLSATRIQLMNNLRKLTLAASLAVSICLGLLFSQFLENQQSDIEEWALGYDSFYSYFEGGY